MGNRRTILALSALVALVIGAGAVRLWAEPSAPGVSAEAKPQRLTPEQFRDEIYPGCSEMNLAYDALIEERRNTRLGLRMQKLKKSVDQMVEHSKEILPPAQLEAAFGRYLKRLDDVVAAARRYVARTPSRLEPLAETENGLARSLLELQAAGRASELFANCTLATEQEALYLSFRAHANAACLDLAHEVKRELPEGSPTSAAESISILQMGADFSRRAASVVRKAAPKKLNDVFVERFAKTYEEIAGAFERGVAAFNSFSPSAYDAAIEDLDDVLDRNWRLARQASLYACPRVTAPF